MTRIYVNLKRFDVPPALGGINRIAPLEQWAQTIVDAVKDSLQTHQSQTEFVFFFPEAHLIPAIQALQEATHIRIGCQGVISEDIVAGGNFGALTTGRPAAFAKAVGCRDVLIGHCEERRYLRGILSEGGGANEEVVSRVLNKEITCSAKQGLSVLYCVGEVAEEHDTWERVLKRQLDCGLSGLDERDLNKITIAYEPIWAVGPGKTPPEPEYIREVARFIKELTGGLPVVYGGGLKKGNAAAISSIQEIDGGLIALTRFSGDIGFYPEEYLKIVGLYLQEREESHAAGI